MSGIAGVIRFDGGPIEPRLIEKVTSAMHYRGPDGINHWVRGSVALGQCMLRTTPESVEETQPLANEDESLVLIMDGRVDNWEELRRELLGRGAKLRTRADAELALRAYETWGRDCLTHIDGDFALAIWDARRREAFCARDRVGVKPFYYQWNGRRLVFASELQALLRIPSVPRALNEGVLAEFLADEWYSREETMWQGVMRLIPANWMSVSGHGVELRQYWQPDYGAVAPHKTDQEASEHYLAVLTEQVRRMSRSQKTVAYEVSGGLDSSAIFAVAEHLRRQNRLPAPGIAGYSLVFPDDAEANEIEYSRSVGRHLRCDLREMRPTHLPHSWYMSSASFYREFPGYPNGVMSLGLCQAARAEGSRAILTGVGGDEWLGMPLGGLYYAEELALKNWRNAYNCFINDCNSLGARQSIWWLFRHGIAPLLPDSVKETRHRLRSFMRKEHGHWLSPKMQSIIRDRRGKFNSGELIRMPRRGQRLQFRFLNDAFTGLAREMEERTSSRIGLELRSPFNSKAIIELAFSTPERLRSRGATTKWLHRRAIKDLLPKLVVDRATKAVFMGVFREQLDRMGEDKFKQIVSRRADWMRC